MSDTIETSKGNKHEHGTHDYPEPLHTIDQDEWDVVIVGAGPAGLMSAASLARFGGHKVLVVDERSEPTTAGRADGIQPRVSVIELRKRCLAMMAKETVPCPLADNRGPPQHGTSRL